MPASPSLPRSATVPFLMASLGIALFAGMDALMKALTLDIGAYNASLWRMLAGAIILSIVFVGRKGQWPTRAVLRLHIIRAVQVSFMIVLYFWGLARVPLAEGIALTFIAPLIALYLAAVTLKERVTPRAIAASFIGFAGVLVIAYGRIEQHASPDVLWGIAAILIAAVCYAFNLIMQRQQAQVATPLEIAFYNTLFVLIVLSFGAPFWAKLPPPQLWPMIITGAVIASASVMLLAWAYARVEAKILLVTEYSAFIWGALIGYAAFHEPITPFTVAGTVLIVGGCVVAALAERDHIPSAELGL